MNKNSESSSAAPQASKAEEGAKCICGLRLTAFLGHLPECPKVPALRAKPEQAEQAARVLQNEPHTDFRFARDAIYGITTAYQDYIRLLNDEIGDLFGIAMVHGFTSKRVELGELCRERIDVALALWQTEVDWHEGRARDSLDTPETPSVEGGSEKSSTPPLSPNDELRLHQHMADTLPAAASSLPGQEGETLSAILEQIIKDLEKKEPQEDGVESVLLNAFSCLSFHKGLSDCHYIILGGEYANQDAADLLLDVTDSSGGDVAKAIYRILQKASSVLDEREFSDASCKPTSSASLREKEEANTTDSVRLTCLDTHWNEFLLWASEAHNVGFGNLRESIDKFWFNAFGERLAAGKEAQSERTLGDVRHLTKLAITALRPTHPILAHLLDKALTGQDSRKPEAAEPNTHVLQKALECFEKIENVLDPNRTTIPTVEELDQLRLLAGRGLVLLSEHAPKSEP